MQNCYRKHLLDSRNRRNEKAVRTKCRNSKNKKAIRTTTKDENYKNFRMNIFQS
jgi:hypothetical protein